MDALKDIQSAPHLRVVSRPATAAPTGEPGCSRAMLPSGLLLTMPDIPTCLAAIKRL